MKSHRIRNFWPSVLVVAALASGCAAPTVVQVRQTGDSDLDCAGLQRQLNEAREFEAKARKERGVTGTNVAAAILFAPALAGTYVNTEEAINAAKERQASLRNIAERKRCKVD